MRRVKNRKREIEQLGRLTMTKKLSCFSFLKGSGRFFKLKFSRWQKIKEEDRGSVRFQICIGWQNGS